MLCYALHVLRLPQAVGVMPHRRGCNSVIEALCTERKYVKMRLGHRPKAGAFDLFGLCCCSELEAVRTHRAAHRTRRQDTPIPVAALVGYTNAGAPDYSITFSVGTLC